jgi:hypothetical protein
MASVKLPSLESLPFPSSMHVLVMPRLFFSFCGKLGPWRIVVLHLHGSERREASQAGGRACVRAYPSTLSTRVHGPVIPPNYMYLCYYC